MIRIYLSLLIAVQFFTCQVFAQINSNKPGELPGDHFSLQGALDMLRKCNDVEAFEKAINTESNAVNNLDLNEDGETDYIRVIDKVAENSHALVLQAVLSEKESQDIATVLIEKTGDEKAELQIVGDENIYGEEVVVEPSAESSNDVASFFFYGNYEQSLTGGPAIQLADESSSNQVIVNVWMWPSVRFVFGPAYRPWISPWGWRRRPIWFRPWRPFTWLMWQPRCVVYNRYYVRGGSIRLVGVRNAYRPYRTTSVIVTTRFSGPLKRHRITRVKTYRTDKIIIQRNRKPRMRGRY